ncbi:MAG: phosphohistidine phosphatase [Lentisphaeria bacterium]|jgi:phosphohistidine phosphatase
MNRKLILMRHAKSDWSQTSREDFDRPLGGRGIVDATGMGQWLKRHDHVPDTVISSPALRAWQTAEAVSFALSVSMKNIHYDRSTYMAESEQLLQVLKDAPARSGCVLLIGHNPELDELLTYLAADRLKRTSDGKLITTAAVAILSIPGDWNNLSAGSGHLLEMKRPSSR